MSETTGVLPVDKPAGPTSHDVVATARKALGIRRIGHTGTLDPFASGLLVLCIGTATRLAEFLTGLPKTYLATMRLGEATNTDDPTGTVIARSDSWKHLPESDINQAVLAQTGTRLQTPPAYSAKKVEGERLYRRARRGEDSAAPPVPVEVHSISVQRIALPEIDLEITCGAGTYIRAIARDIGAHLMCYGHLRSLRRTRSGSISVENAVPGGSLRDEAAVSRAWIEPAAAVGHLQRIEIDEAGADRFVRGMVVPVAPGRRDDPAAAILYSGQLLGIGTVSGGQIRPRKVLTG